VSYIKDIAIELEQIDERLVRLNNVIFLLEMAQDVRDVCFSKHDRARFNTVCMVRIYELDEQVRLLTARKEELLTAGGICGFKSSSM
jgi:hypothetical protein